MIILFFIIAVLVSLFFYRKTLPEISLKRRLILQFLRTISIFILLLLLFNPVLFFKQNYYEKPVLLLLSDKSNSMKQRIDDKAKSEHLKDFEKEIEKRALKSNYSVEYVELFKDNPKQSVLLDEIKDKLQTGRDVKAIALASDAWFQDDPVFFRQLIEIPVYTFKPDINEDNAELKILNLSYNKNARKSEIQPIRVEYSVQNFEGSVIVKLLHDGKVTETKKQVITSKNIVNQIDFSVQFEDTGLKVFEIEVSLEDSEIKDSSFGAIQVLDNKAKILMLTDNFSWDLRVFNRVLNIEDRFDVDLVYNQHGRMMKKGEPVEINWAEYSGFIVFNKDNFNFKSSDIDVLKTRVLNGSGLIFVGNVHPQFEEVLPTRVSNIKITGDAQTRLKPEALSYQIFRDIEQYWLRFPPVQYYFLTPKEQSVVLAEVRDNQQIPAIILGNYGTGSVLHFSFNGLWRCLLNTEDGQFDKFISGIGQWIFSSNSDNFYAFTDKNVYYSGEKITVKLSAFDEKLNPLSNVNANLELFDSQNNKVFSDFLIRTGDFFVIDIPDFNAGIYKYKIYDDINNRKTEGEYELLKQDIQSLSKGFNFRLMKELSSSSAGSMLTPENLKTFEFEKAEAIKKVRYLEVPLYKNIFIIVLFIFGFCLELFLRKKWGLL